MSEQDNPWTKLTSRSVFRNDWLELFDDSVITPSGTKGSYGVVRMRNRAAGILAIDGQGRVVLVGQYRYPLDRYSWEIVEGGVPPGEDVMAGAKRELAEEAGLTAANWTELLRLDLSNSLTDDSAVVYLAWGLSETESHPDETEQLALKRLSFADTLALVMEGGITDAISVAAILKTEISFRQGCLPEPVAALLHSPGIPAKP